MKKPITEYKAVFFDAGDTLVTIPAAYEIMHSYLANQGFKADPVKLRTLLEEGIYHFYYNKKDFTDEAITPDTDRSFWIRIYRFIMDRMDARRNWTEEQIHRCCHEMYDLFVDPEYYTLFDDVKETLERLCSMGFQLGLVSNFAHTLREICIRHGIYDYFDPFVVSTEVGLEKPNPAIFTLALSRGGRRPEDVVYVGDHETNDVWSPGQVGIDAIRINRYDGFQTEGIRSLRELFTRL